MKLIAALVGLIALASETAFTASHPELTARGVGVGEVSGVEVTDVDYVLNVTDEGKIDAVTFTVVPATPKRVRIKLASGRNTWYRCENLGGRVTCPTTAPQATLAATDSLSVLVAG